MGLLTISQSPGYKPKNEVRMSTGGSEANGKKINNLIINIKAIDQVQVIQKM